MVGKKGSGHDPTSARMLEVLERIETGIEDLRRDLVERLDQTNARIDQTNARLDNLIAVSGAGYRDHEERLRKVEIEVARLAGRGA